MVKERSILAKKPGELGARGVSAVSDFARSDRSAPLQRLVPPSLTLGVLATAALAAGLAVALQDAALVWSEVLMMATPAGAIAGAGGLWWGRRGARGQASGATPPGEAPPESLIEAMQVMASAFACWDAEGRLVAANPAFTRMFGLGADTLRPDTAHADFAQHTRQMIRQSIKPEAGVSGLREIEFRDGRWAQTHERRTPSGGLVMTAVDITALKLKEAERNRDEEALRDAINRLEGSQTQLSDLAREYEAEKLRAVEANRAKSEFLANMSHELRTPLNAIIGFSEIMTQELFGPLGARTYRGYANDILASGQHLLALINDVLDMSKIEAGKMTLHRERLDVEALAEEALRLVRNRAENSGLMLIADVGEDLPEVEADARALKQILLNLLSNAVKFTPAGGRIAVRARAEAGGVRLSVHDTGIGIGADDLLRLAAPFEQVERQQSKTTQGTGLGLALSKAFVELHGSNLTIESAPGEGTRVSFLLPPSGRQEPGPHPVGRA
jgi:two-component system cell cycle sensor histidine kinase PleC